MITYIILTQFVYKENVITNKLYIFQGRIKLWKADEDDSSEFANAIEQSSIIFLTPMSLFNRLIDTTDVKVSIGDFSLLVFDECHHCHDHNPYNEIMVHYRRAKYEEKLDKLPQVLYTVTVIDNFVICKILDSLLPLIQCVCFCP